MTQYIDTHIHLDLLSDLETQLEEARKAGVDGWVVPGISSDSWLGLMTVVDTHAGVYAAPGIHPLAAECCEESHVVRLRQLLEHPKAVALGEVGLDRQVQAPWQRQEEVFVQMIRLAREMNKPLLIHTRQSTGRTLEILEQEGASQVGGIFHAFSGSLETARHIIDMGFALGIGGVVTFSTARRLPQIVREVPAEALVLETDAPEMAPEPHRGQLNRPAYLALTAERVAALRGWTTEETARITTANACRILRIQAKTSHGVLQGKNA